MKRVEEKMEEENEKIRGRDWRTVHFSRGEILRRGVISRSLMVDFILFSLFTLFYFSFIFPFYFSIFRTTQVRVYQSCCHISHKLMA